MNDHIFEDMLSRRLKRATAEVAEATPLKRGIARSIASHPSDNRKPSAPRRLVRSRIGIAIALVVGVAFASGTAYAGLTLLQAVTQTDPGAAAVYRQNLGEALSLAQTRDGVTVTLERAYADVNRVMITYGVHTSRGAAWTFNGFAMATGQPTVTDSRGHVLRGYDASFETDPLTNETVGMLAYDAELATQNVRDLALNVTVSGINMRSGNGASTVVGPYAFDLRVAMTPGETIQVNRMVIAHDIGVSLDRVVASPSETRIYLRSSVPSAPTDVYLAARIIGNGYDTRAAVFTSAGQLLTLGAGFEAPGGEQVVTFTNTLFGKRGSFTLTVESIGVMRTGDGSFGERVAGPWVIHFRVP